MRLRKVIAYIVRESNNKRELLVFTHRDDQEAGLQVPAGTVEAGEAIEAGLRREVKEETGLTDFQIVRKLATYEWIHPISGNLHERHVFHLIAPPDTADNWEWVETSGGQVPEHAGYVFCFRWDDLAGNIDLAGHQGDYLAELRDTSYELTP